VEGLYLLVGEDPVRAGLVASMNPARPGNGCELLHKAICGQAAGAFSARRCLPLIQWGLLVNPRSGVSGDCPSG
ncbi:MAG TPA: hypothetical protein VM715_10060, partial [Candidatus Acidoferrum sp.]|nr:hypothetical protein [Candidatus Acidoferrum sp.]